MCNGDKNSIFWRDRNVYVTGASGLLGRWLVNALNTAGANVVGLIRDWCRSNPSDWRHQPVALHSALRFTVFGNLEDYELQLRTLNEYEIDTVFHLGAQPIVGVANRNPRSTFEANIRGTWNILEACRHIKTVQRVIMASSDKAYGDQPNLPYEESMPLQGKHPYDVSKSCADLIAQTYHNTYGIPVCITRCGNFFGGGDLNFNRIVPGTIRSILHGKAPIIRSDGMCIRDYVYVKDVSDFYLHLATCMENSSIHGQAYNYSAENHISVIDMTKKLLHLMQREDLSPIILNEAKNEISHQYLSASKSRNQLDWVPHVTLDEALRETIEWYRNFMNPTPQTASQ